MNKTDTDYQICLQIITNLSSPNLYKKLNNWLFLEPVNLAEFPTYSTIVSRPMDLGTVMKHLQSGTEYKRKEDCFRDVMLIFENAERFHSDRPDTSWIVRVAGDMMKMFNRERRRAEKNFLGQSSSSSGSNGGSGKSLKLKLGKNKDKSSNGNMNNNNSSDGGGGGAPKLSKLKISIKNSSSSSNNPSGERELTSKERKRKRKSSSSPTNGVISSTKNGASSHNHESMPSSTTSSLSSGAVLPAPTPSSSSSSQPSKPKLKLKLTSVKKDKDQNNSSSSSTPMATTPTSTTSNSSSTAKAQPAKPKMKLKLSLGRKNAQQQQQQSSKNDTKASTSNSGVGASTNNNNSNNTSSSRMKESSSSKKPSSSKKISPTSSSSSKKSNNMNSHNKDPSSINNSNNNRNNKQSQQQQQQQQQPPPITISITPKSRGKELPKGVVAPPTKPTTTPKSSSSTTTTATASVTSSGNTSFAPVGTSSSSSEQPPPNKKIRLSLSSKSKPSTDVQQQQQQKTGGNKNDKNNNNGNSSPKGTSSSKGTTTKTTSSKGNTKTSASKSSNTSKPSPIPVELRPPTMEGDNMTPRLKAQCFKVISALKQREKNCADFLKPVISMKVNNPKLNDDYRAKIPFPMDLGTMSTKLDRNQYPTVSSFVHDIRRIFANCLRFNDTAKNPFRPAGHQMLVSAEHYINLFLHVKAEDNAKSDGGSKFLYPRLLYCWEKCMHIMDELLKHKNPPDKQDPYENFPTTHFFLHPVSYFMGGSFREDYLEKVKEPMDLGTITSKLCEGVYQDVQSFVSDCRLVPANCKVYYDDREDGTQFVMQATRLEEAMSKHLDSLIDYGASAEGENSKKIAGKPAPIQLLNPPKIFYTAMLTELRKATYTDKLTKLSEKATLRFEDPVDLVAVPDYFNFVHTPMAFKTIDKKIEENGYPTAEDFEYDVSLIFKNCETYNLIKKNSFLIQRSKNCAKVFRRLYSTRMKAFVASEGKKLFGEEKKDRKRTEMSSTAYDEAPASKKAKLSEGTTNAKKLAASSTSKVASKTVARKSPTTAIEVQTQSASAPPQRSKSPRPITSTTKKASSRSSTKNTPIQEAVDQIKMNFTLRDSKFLEGWEDGCFRFLSALKRHPWLTGVNPKFIFHVPVPALFPQIKAEYESKIRNPMDLTTSECKLLQGGFYNDAEDFICDVALVFTNAIQFNKEGHEEGESMSCAYFDASMHLLKYARWLSLEMLSLYLKDDSQSEGEKQTGALPHWKLTTSNRKDSIEEMESFVMNFSMDKSEEGDRLTWMEGECEKLLKALRHQSDLKHMTYFIQTKYPADYLSYISKPMDWANCQKSLQQRKYDTFGAIVEDLRLIFSNALKYNARHKDIDSESGRISARAYDSAAYMSEKLEVAINRMLLTVSDRIHREKIDRQNLDRQTEAAERAQMEETKKMMRENSRSVADTTTERKTVQTVNIIAPKKINVTRRDYDEEPTHLHTQMQEIMHHKFVEQKQTEKARQDSSKLSQLSRLLGGHVYHNLSERESAIVWSKHIAAKVSECLPSTKTQDCETSIREVEKGSSVTSTVLSILENSERNQIKIAFGKKTKKKTKKKSTKKKNGFNRTLIFG